MSFAPMTLAAIFLPAHKEQGPLTIHIGGRSGSGKSIIVREVRTQLDTCGLRSTVISTDDYHRGTSWLQEYNAGEPGPNWDDPIVYDTATMARDLELLRTGQPIYARSIDWTVAEPVLTGTIEPTDVIIIEGIAQRLKLQRQRPRRVRDDDAAGVNALAAAFSVTSPNDLSLPTPLQA